MPEPVVYTEQPLTRFTAQSLKEVLRLLRRLSVQAESPRAQQTDTASSPRRTDAPTPRAAS